MNQQSKLKSNRKKRTSPVTSSDESDFSFKSDSSSEYNPENEIFTDSDKESENSIDSALTNQEITEHTLQNLEINQWVLVKFAVKKSIKHYVGVIIDHCENNKIYTAKFVRKAKFLRDGQFIFTYPNVDDICDVSLPDILCVLPKPIKGRRGEIIFKISFEGFNIQ